MTIHRGKLMRHSTLCAAIVALALAPVPSSAASSTIPSYVKEAVADTSRPADDRKWDVVRKPAAVLAAARVKPGEIIAEYLPGGGYYTRLLSDVVGPRGKIFALETTTWGKQNIDATKTATAALKNVSLDLAPLGTFHLPEKVDLFWTSNNYHDLHIPKYAKIDMAVFNKLVFNSLKSGGTYFILDHAAAIATGASMSPTLHRIERQKVVDEVTSAGFKLVGESDVLRNPADDHTKTVFDPAMRFRTDQFILIFRKP
jgi:predicted methyltransferase